MLKASPTNKERTFQRLRNEDDELSTTADALNDIQIIQAEMQHTLTAQDASINDNFIPELFSFTTARFFDLCAHSVLETLRDPVHALRHPYAEKYYSLFDQRPVLDAQIYWSNHSGLFSLWNIFERFIRAEAECLGLTIADKLDRCYKSILRARGIRDAEYRQVFEEFEAMRITRNSLHSGGIYDYSKARRYHFRGELCSFDPGTPVVPLRLLDVVQTMWEHYRLIKGLR